MDLETCSWCADEWDYKCLAEMPDGAMICPNCKEEAAEMFLPADVYY